MTLDDSILDRVQIHLREMAGYVPIDPPDVLADRIGLPAEQIIKLDGNENPYGPSAGTPMYSACFGVSRVSLTPSFLRCSLATFSSRCLGNV